MSRTLWPPPAASSSPPRPVAALLPRLPSLSKAVGFSVYIKNENMNPPIAKGACGRGKGRESDLRTTEEEGCRLLTIFSVFWDKPA